MRILPWPILVTAIVISLALAANAEARLFWQTYGSTVPTADGCGCTWNWNQDYFVPRHPSSCRYGLFSPCKTSCTTSPACKWCHPFYPGYCSIYGPCHYRRKNHVYSAYCGCSPIEVCVSRCSGLCRNGRCGGGCSCSAGGCSTGGCCAASGGYYSADCYQTEAPLHNVEPSHMDILGSIPVDGSELLTRTDLSQLGNEQGGGQLLLQPRGGGSLLPGLPGLNLPLPQSLPRP